MNLGICGVINVFAENNEKHLQVSCLVFGFTDSILLIEAFFIMPCLFIISGRIIFIVWSE